MRKTSIADQRSRESVRSAFTTVSAPTTQGVERIRPTVDARIEGLSGDEGFDACKLQTTSFDHHDRRFILGRVLIRDQLSPEQRDALKTLLEAERRGLKRLFRTLAPPVIESLAGEYDAQLLDQGSPLSNTIVQRAFAIHGSWIGKAFYPVNATSGVGYNCFDSGGSIVRKLPMDIAIEPSTLTHGHSMIIRYKAKNRGLIRWLVGEVRQVTSGVMLGIGVYGPSLGYRDIWRRKIPFVMFGPRRSFQHKLDYSLEGKAA